MATNTTNYNLVKPATTDFYDISVPNGNMDIIDQQMKKMDVQNADTKTTIADADTIGLQDSADTNKIKKITWANIKSVLSNLFAASSHSHSAADITSGALSVARGGTGANDATNGLKNLDGLSRTVKYYNVATNLDSITDGTVLCNIVSENPTLHSIIGEQFAYVIQIQYDSDSQRRQIAIGYNNNKMAIRAKVSGAWNTWTPVYTGASVIPLANGGTGVTTLANLKTLLGISDVTTATVE